MNIQYPTIGAFLLPPPVGEGWGEASKKNNQ
jgi:hypothetical protein